MSKHSRISGLVSVLVFASLLATFSQQARAIALPILTRPVLKSFFQSGDKPTQSQFAAFIDSMVNYADDRQLLGLKVYNPTAGYVAGDTAIAQRLLPGASIGAVDQGSSGAPEFGGLAGLDFNNPLSFDLTTHFAGQFGFLGLKLQAPNGDINYGYLQMSMATPSSLSTEPPAINVEYIVYNDIANQPLVAEVVPLPTTAAMGFAFVPLMFVYWFRRRLSMRRAV